MKALKKAVMTVCWVVVFLALTIFVPPVTNHFFAGDNQLMLVMVYDSGTVHTHRAGANTIAGLLTEIGLTVGDFDRTNHSLDSPIWEGLNLVIFREVAFGIRINGGETAYQLILPGTTVNHVLVQQQIEHELTLLYTGELDRYIENGEVLNFVTWDSHYYTEVEVIPYETVENHTGAVREGRQHIRQEGVDGEHQVTNSVIVIGGEEANRAVIGQTVTIDPIDKIIDIGTARLGALTDPTREDFHYVRHLRMEATAYTAGFSCTGKHPCDPWWGITASGRRVEHGIVAVDRNVIPLGTWLYVEGYGFALAADVGSAIRGYKIDLFMHCIQDARRFGRRHINVWILE